MTLLGVFSGLHKLEQQIHDFLYLDVLRHRRIFVCFTMLISERDFTVRGAFLLPGERGLAPCLNEARRRFVSLTGIMRRKTHEFEVKPVADFSPSKTNWITLIRILHAHFSNRWGEIAQPGHPRLDGREKGRVT